MKLIKEGLEEIFKEWFEDVFYGFSLSGISAVIIPEIIHLVFIIMGGIVGTICIHLTKVFLAPPITKWVKKKFQV